MFKESEVIVFGEFKSYASMNNFLNAGSDTYKQFISYLRKIKSLDELHYYFDIEKISDIGIIKNRFKIVFQNNADEIFDIVWNNQQLKISLFTENQTKALSKIEFLDLVEDQSSILYNFIKLE